MGVNKSPWDLANAHPICRCDFLVSILFGATLNLCFFMFLPISLSCKMCIRGYSYRYSM